MCYNSCNVLNGKQSKNEAQFWTIHICDYKTDGSLICDDIMFRGHSSVDCLQYIINDFKE